MTMKCGGIAIRDVCLRKIYKFIVHNLNLDVLKWFLPRAVFLFSLLVI